MFVGTMYLQIQAHATLMLLLTIPSVLVASYTQFQKFPSSYTNSFSAQETSKKQASRLAKPLIGDDGRVYVCSEKNFFAFDSNGSIAWTINLNYTCNTNIVPVHGGSRKIYLVAENRVFKVNPFDVGAPGSAVEEFFGPSETVEIIGLDVSVSSSCVVINVRNRGLFAFRLYGQMLWSAGPVLHRHGYRQGCRKSVSECYFSSNPVIDHCEASIYISNNQGELYSLSVRSPHFKWIQDFSSLDTRFTVIPASNGLLYVTFPGRALVLALDVSTGNILWQGNTGPLSSEDYAPAVDSNGWISLGSLDGILYSFSPMGALKKFSKVDNLDFVIQVSPVVDCSGYGVYVSQTEMDGKVGNTKVDYTYISALKPKRAVFTMLVPATGAIFWSESYPPGQISYRISQSNLQHFKLDEITLLAFMAASSTGNPLPCRTTRQKFASSCSQTSPKSISIYTGNGKTILLFLLFETTIMITLAALVRFCCIFWKKRKLQSQGLVKFLERRHSLRLQKKEFDRSITELERKTGEEAEGHNETMEELNLLVMGREGIQRKLSTTYSLGRDKAAGSPLSKSLLLPLYDGKSRSYSFQGAGKESVTIFRTFSDGTSSNGSSGESGSEAEDLHGETELQNAKAKGKAPVEVHGYGDNEIYEECKVSPSASGSSSGGFVNPLYVEHSSSAMEGDKDNGEGLRQQDWGTATSSIRRRASSSTN